MIGDFSEIFSTNTELDLELSVKLKSDQMTQSPSLLTPFSPKNLKVYHTESESN